MKQSILRVSITLALVSSANAFSADLPPVIEISSESQSFIPAPVTKPKQNNAVASQLLVEIEQLKSEVRSLRGQVEDQAFRIKKMESAQLDRYRDLDRRMSSIMAQMAQVSNPSPAVQPTLPSDTAKVEDAPEQAVAESAQSLPADANVVAVVPAPAPTVTPTATPTPAATEKAPEAPVAEVKVPAKSDAQAYREAFDLVRSRKYDQAIAAFEVFIEGYPNSARVANAFYWMGEIYQVEQKPEAAREKFTVVVGQYPDHPKTPTAAFRLGVIYAELGDPVKSKEYLDYVLTNHPDSNVVPMVNEFLNK